MATVHTGQETACLAATFTGAGARGFLHAKEIGRPGEVGLDADQPVVLASVFKVPVALAYACAVATGRLDPGERVTVGPGDRVGGIGTAGCADDVVMSWRDLARFMLTMSDNAATDVLLRRIGINTVRALLIELGLRRTRLIGGCAEIFATMKAELGHDSVAELENQLAATDPDRIWSMSALDPARTTASTPREITTLLDAIWQDQAGPPSACAELRAVMADQVWPHRLSSGFPDEVKVSAKTGTLPAIRNEVGVVEYPDGRRFAIAVFTRAATLSGRAPAIDAAIGSAARLAVELLRGERA